jgi:hypothetical protein
MFTAGRSTAVTRYVGFSDKTTDVSDLVTSLLPHLG